MTIYQFFQKNSTYTLAEQSIINFIYENPNAFLTCSISQLAKNLGISDATVSRFAKHAGYKDFKELKSAIANTIEGVAPADKLAGTLAETKGSTLENFLITQQYYLQKTLNLIDVKAFDLAVNLITKTKHIYIHGKGAANCLAKLLAFRLNRFGKYVTLLPSSGSELFESMVQIPKDSLVILFGFQKLPKEVQVLLRHRQKVGYQTLLFRSRLYTDPEFFSDINLYIYRGEPKEYHSMTAPMAVIDALIVQVAAQMGTSAMKSLELLHQTKEQYHSDLPN
jgi:DNA-binding MurR/RpiR family transcriptional regulator